MDFRKIKKRSMPLTMRDGKKLSINMPSKNVFDILLELQQAVATGVELNDTGLYDRIFELFALCLSNNAQGILLSKSDVSDYDFDDVQTFMSEYLSFVTGGISDPN